MCRFLSQLPNKSAMVKFVIMCHCFKCLKLRLRQFVVFLPSLGFSCSLNLYVSDLSQMQQSAFSFVIHSVTLYPMVMYFSVFPFLKIVAVVGDCLVHVRLFATLDPLASVRALWKMLVLNQRGWD